MGSNVSTSNDSTQKQLKEPLSSNRAATQHEEAQGREIQESKQQKEEEEAEQSGESFLTPLQIELLCEVVSYLDLYSLVSLGCTSRHFRDVLLNNERFWQRLCKAAFGFCLLGNGEAEDSKLPVNKVLYESWKTYDPQNSPPQHRILSLSCQQYASSLRIGHGGINTVYQYFVKFKSNFKYAEDMLWYGYFDPSPVVRAYSCHGCIELLKSKQTRFPSQDSVKELLCQLGLQLVSCTDRVNTVLVFNGERLGSVVVELISGLLTPSQMNAINDKILEINIDEYEVRKILFNRAGKDRKDQNLHDKIRDMTRKGEWYAIVRLAEYRDESQDLNLFVDLLDQYTQSTKKQQRGLCQIFKALQAFPHPILWTKLLNIHRSIVEGTLKASLAFPSSGEPSLYDAIASYRTNEAIEVLDEAIDNMKMKDTNRSQWKWGNFTATLSCWLKEKGAPYKERVSKLVWKVYGRTKHLTEAVMNEKIWSSCSLVIKLKFGFSRVKIGLQKTVD